MTAEPSERIEEADERVVFRVPFIDHPVTPNEIHAVVIGAAVGVLIAWLYAVGYTSTALVAGGTIVGYALFGKPFLTSLPHGSVEYEKTIALKTVRHEPWWFLAPFVLALWVVLYA